MFENKIVRLANLPPWASKHTLENGQDIYWAETGPKNHPLALRVKDNLIYLPKSLRGRSLADIRQSDLDALDKDDSGFTHYKLWKSDFDRKQDVNKIWDGLKFSAYGLILFERLKRFFAKSHLDNVESLGLDPAYNIDLGVFDKITQSNDLSKIKRMGRTLAKKYKMITLLLKAAGKNRLVTKLDKDFSYHFSKLENFLDFDPSSYKPTAPDKDDEEVQDEAQPDSLLLAAFEHFVIESQEYVDPQMAEFIKCLNQLEKNVRSNNLPKSQAAFEKMSASLMRLIGMGHGSEVAKKAEKILTLPSIVSLYDKLFGAEPLA